MLVADRTILIIDDEPDTVTFLRTWLEDQGFQTLSATDGVQGMRMILEEKPDLILMDLKMPNKTGMQVYRELSRLQTSKPPPVIFITGMTDQRIYGDECQPLPEPVARIDKPIDLKALHAAIEKALG